MNSTRSRVAVVAACLAVTTATPSGAGGVQQEEAGTLPAGNLAFGAFVASFAGDGAFRIEGEGWPTFTGSWEISGS